MSINTIIKFLCSYLKKDWEFIDYPINTWRNPNARETNVLYGAGIANWAGLVGHGETIDNAIEQLQERFKEYKKNNEKLPRPGTKVSLKFASSENMQKYSMVAEDYLHTIFKLEYHEGFYSDGSVLEYFILPTDDYQKSKQRIIEETRNHYGVDISKLFDEPLWKILKKIDETKEPK